MRRLAALLVAVSIAGAAPAVAPVGDSVPLAPATAEAKRCSSGYTHAALPWGHKCLRRGQFCKYRYRGRRADRYYHRYGYHCHRRDGYGYRLS